MTPPPNRKRRHSDQTEPTIAAPDVIDYTPLADFAVSLVESVSEAFADAADSCGDIDFDFDGN